jgi:hypothetical protein
MLGPWWWMLLFGAISGAPSPRVASPEPHGPLLGVTAAASPDGAGGVATWTATQVFVRERSDSSFSEVLTTDRSAPIRAVTLSRSGDVLAVTGPDDSPDHAGPPARTLLHRAPGRAARTLPFPTGEVDALAVGGAGELAALTYRSDEPVPARLWASVDGGETWEDLEAPLGTEGAELAWGRDGELYLMTAVESSCGGGHQSRHVWDRTARTWADAGWPLDTPFAWGLGAGGEGFGVSLDGCGATVRGGPAVCSTTTGAAVARVALTDDGFRPFAVFHDGARTVATYGDAVVELGPGPLRVLPHAISPDVEVRAVDPSGSALGLRAGHLVRFDGGGWVRIL